ncbi:Low molecular weight protein-tyrosine-phosphatase ywlE [[Clostridium] ultunense Esp]|uniref:Protein-arginine(Tyrosine) phosphatase n=2 Tax=Schnuerera ultunensis TaxID=45497 RepID=M1ZA40_9FIRM|nr:low molecular weight protein arginine phosphatase [Schnuerera ultunensis]CCQ94714.1 Low molecular weight protein-tyrosine-phosphatase ywlE [[Clostridium] ultunense Esp]SHD76583.1 protein-arginine(tyrosine) phosphatase [[Clostridium] ultunense Esp]
MNILFVCTGNTCRSPMAQALLEEVAKEKGLDIKVKSAGIFALDGQEASKNAIEVLKSEGIDLRDHRARIIYRDLLEEADLILTMGISHKRVLLSKFDFIQGKIYTLKEYAYGKEEDIDDPFGGDIQAYDKAKVEIKEALKEMVKQWK